MKEISQYISKNCIWIIVGLILTVISVKMVYVQRGYIAYGGEYLTLPLVLMIVSMVKKVIRMVRYLLGTEDENELD